MQREEIVKIVFESLNVINSMRSRNQGKLPLDEETRLLGENSKLDSLGLVTLLIDIEQRLVEKYSLSVDLLEEQTASSEKKYLSSVKTLIDYIFIIAQRENND
jgi:acyl carrier protein